MGETLLVLRLPKMTKQGIEKLIKEQRICRIAFKGEKHPYIAPFQYVTINGSLYFHFTNYGRKMKLLQEDERVCVEIESYRADLSEYRFVVLSGTLKVVTDTKERAKAIKKMAQDGKQNLSENFLVAHGFNKDQGWASLTPDKPLVIVKLEKTEKAIGLKSP